MKIDAGDGKYNVEPAKAMERLLERMKGDSKEMEELERLKGLKYQRFDRKAVVGSVGERRAFLSSCLKEVESSMKEQQEGLVSFSHLNLAFITLYIYPDSREIRVQKIIDLLP